MKTDGKLDYLELQAGDGALAGVKAFYAAAFGWRFTDYGPSYAAFAEGLAAASTARRRGRRSRCRSSMPRIWSGRSTP